MRIAIVGAPGSGKTTLSSQIFDELKKQGHRAEHVHEWIRNDIQQNGPMASVWEQYRTRQHQQELEDAVPNVEYIVHDGGTLLPYFYSVLYANHDDPRQRLVIQDMYRYLLNDLYCNRYELVLYVPLIAPSDLKDGTRYQTNEEVEFLDDFMRMVFIKLHPMKTTHMITANFDDRLKEAMQYIPGVKC